MRRLLVALALLGVVSNAFASEFEIPTLRGSSAFEPSPFVPAAPKYTRWAGFYGGGQVGFGSAHVDFAGTTRQLVAFELRELALESQQAVSNWAVLGMNDTGSSSYGGFVGYNSQWDDVILGVELNYSKTKYFSDAPSEPIGRVTSAGGNSYLVQIAGDAVMNITDFGTARMRAGYVMKNIMPWAMAGFTTGRANLTRSVTITGTETTSDGTVTPFAFARSETRTNAWIFGWAVGGGVDVMMLPNVFVRGEYEYVSFAGVAGVKAGISTARAGAGFKF